MPRKLLILITILAAIAVAPSVLWRIMGIRAFFAVPSPGELYPVAPTMPLVVAEPIEQLLFQYERILAEHSPTVFTALQPGLTDAQIDALESKHQFKLTPDLRALYRWRNGMPYTTDIYTFPDHCFVPLDQTLASRDELQQELKAATPAQQEIFALLILPQDQWLWLIIDPYGDGYFFDPDRSEAQGSFFFCLTQDMRYIFFP